MVGRDHLRKYVGCRERDFGYGGLCGRSFQRQRILELMCQGAQLAQSAGRGVAFQGVHGPADHAHDLLIARLLFELQRLVVQRLQQFL